MSPQQVVGRGACEWRLTGKQLVESHSQAVHVRLGDRLLFLDRLGGDVGPRPLDDPAFLLDLAGQ